MDNNELNIDVSIFTDNIDRSFIAAVEIFISEFNTTTNLTDIYKEGLKTFLHLDKALASSLFLFNNNSIEFENKFTFPDEYAQKSIECFDELIEKENIGFVLNSGKVVLFTKNAQNNCKYDNLVIPLITSEGIFGIVLVLLSDTSSEINLFIQRDVSFFATIYARTIENALLFQNLNRNNQLLEQKIAEKTLHLTDSRRELNAIFDSVQAGVMVINNSNNLISKCNNSALILIGSPENNIIDKNYNLFLDFESLISEHTELSKNYESNFKKADDSIIPILRTTSFLNLGALKYRIESFLDITDIREAQDKLKEYNELLELKVEERTEDLQLLVHKLKNEISEREKAEAEVRMMLAREKELSDMKSRFVSMVSHEFRTPLTVIRSSSQLIEKFYHKLSDEDKFGYLKKIVQTVDSIKELIENVIFIGTQELDSKSSNFNELNLHTFCLEIIHDINITYSNKTVFEFSYLCPTEIYKLDEKLLRLIIYNLLSNAVKYTKSEDIIYFRICENNGFITFEIEDHGIGIPIDEQEKIFDSFYRAKNVGNVSGTGIGLSVVLRSVELLDGSIDINSKVGIGTIIKINIPINK